MHSFQRYSLAAILLAVVCLTSGCGGGSYSKRDFVADEGIDRRLRVAVLPLENLTNHPSAGIIVSQMLVTELYKQNVFQLEEETAIRNWMTAEQIDINKLTDITYAQEVARSLRVDAVLIGSVSEFGYQHGLHEESTVGFSIRLLRADDGKVLWAAGHATVGRGYIGRESVSETAQKVAERMVTNLIKKIR